ncbi:MAG: helix-turn-helix domain-containing protein [Leptothrix sp. (in: b-proteobacteria)]
MDEIARLYDVHRNTVRSWIKHGLRTVDARRPLLVLGRDLADFLQQRRTEGKHPCGPDELYCLRCRAPRQPAHGQLIYRPLTPTQGNLTGLCSCCGAKVNRRVSLAKLPQVEAVLCVARMQGEGHIDESPNTSLNSDFIKDGHDHAHASP